MIRRTQTFSIAISISQLKKMQMKSIKPLMAKHRKAMLKNGKFPPFRTQRKIIRVKIVILMIWGLSKNIQMSMASKVCKKLKT